MSKDYDRDSRLESAVVDLLDSADDTGCEGDLIVVSKEKLRAVAEEVCDELPAWLAP